MTMQLMSNATDVFSVSDLHQKLPGNIRDFDQHDATDALDAFLNCPSTPSDFRRLFLSKVKVTSRCHVCQTDAVNESLEPYVIVPLQKRAGSTKPNTEDLLARVFKTESKQSHECSTCCPRLGKHVRQTATTTTELVAVGDIFLVSLTLRMIDANGSLPHKNLEAFHLSQQIKVAGAIYDLHCVIIHIGKTADGGHFTFLRRFANNWWEINDEAPARLSCEPTWSNYKTPCMMCYIRGGDAEPTVWRAPSSRSHVSEKRQREEEAEDYLFGPEEPMSQND